MTEDLAGFLCRAKKATYAGHGAEVESSRPKSHDLKYAEGEYAYIDSYLGGEKFAGEEAVWHRGEPVWAMNYCGRVLGEGFSGEFLKAALSMASEDSPYRGPAAFKDGELSYRCNIDGGAGWFQGYEEIRRANIKVYECHFHGGKIK